MSQDDEIQPQKPVWLTTREVIDNYGFDPRPFVSDLKSKLKLIPATGDAETCTQRLWEQNSVQYHAATKAKES